MACLNSKVFSNIITLLAKTLFSLELSASNVTSHFQFKPFPHFCLPFLDFFIRLIVFYKPFWAFFTLSKVKFIKTLSSFVTYWHAFDMTCLKQVPLQTYKNLNNSQSIINHNVASMVPKLLPSSFTKTITWWINPIF
jgi:hypothetical protein